MDSWFKIVELRKEVREGRSYNPDEFVIHLEQVVAKTAPEDYRNPAAFFSRTCFTRTRKRCTDESQGPSPVMTAGFLLPLPLLVGRPGAPWLTPSATFAVLDPGTGPEGAERN